MSKFWPGFGDGTFHDPDRYVREGRQKDDSGLKAFCDYVNSCEPICWGRPSTVPAIEDAPEVTEAMKIMYPEVK